MTGPPEPVPHDHLEEVTGELVELRERLAAIDHGPVAIISMGCRLPGGITDPDQLWDALVEGRDLIGDFPTDRGWDLGGLFHADPDHPGTSYTRHAGFLADPGAFDAAFFNISPREALAMDPQQRLLLELAWETVERARLDPATLDGTPTGVFVGAIGSDYASARDGAEGYRVTGNLTSVISGRIAYFLGLTGPAVTVDTACSSSLTALHLAVQALRRGECSLALAGGVTVLASPMMFVEFSRQRVLAPDGRCKPFSADADGTSWAEGAGLLLLERLSDAQANNHPVLAVIRGSAVNQDGASNGLAAPNGMSQQRVIRQALADAHLTSTDVDVVETHGSGTALGDPIEANALHATYGRNRPTPLYIGSVKSNLGHTGATAGVTGAIKMVLALRHRVLPMTLHSTAPTPHVDWRDGNVELLPEARPWPDVAGRPRRAAVSSFGISGTNAHLILEQASATSGESTSGERTGGSPVDPLPSAGLFLLSAKTSSALQAQAARLHTLLTSRPELALPDLAYSLATTRSRFPHRTVIAAASRSELLNRLSAMASTRPARGLTHGTVRGDARTVFVFPGQGTQSPGMGRDLYEANPVFRTQLDACARALGPHVDWKLVDTLREVPGSPPLDRVDVVQPALWAIMIALARLWESHGVHPDAVIGHSQGEIAAAHIAGALTLDDAATIVAVRGKALRELAGSGAMASLRLSADDTDTLLTGWRGRVSIAAVNGPVHTTVSGDATAIDEILARCAHDGIGALRLNVDYASHSAHVDPIRQHILHSLAGIRSTPTHTPFYSTVDGQPHDTPLDGTTLNTRYWWHNLRDTVHFHHTATHLITTNRTCLIEISPHPTLLPTLHDTTTTAHIPTLRRGSPATFTNALARAYATGIQLDQESLTPSAGVIDLPTYPFEHARYWLAPAPGKDRPELTSTGHPLVTTSTPGPAHPNTLTAQLATLPEREHPAAVLDTVLAHTAAVVGHASPGDIDLDKTFKDIGFDSLTSIELRNSLAAATGLRLPTSLVFDHPSPAQVARHLVDRLGATSSTNDNPAIPRSDTDIRASLMTIPLSDPGTGGTDLSDASPDDLVAMAPAEDNLP